MHSHFRSIFAILVLLSSIGIGATASSAQTSQEDTTYVSDVTGVTIDLGPTGDAVFDHDSYKNVEAENYTLESFRFIYGTTIVILDVMDGNVNIDDYMLTSETEIATTYDYTDWLGGEWSATHSWDVYSGAYKLDYREHVYLDLIHDRESGLYHAIGIYGSAEDLPVDIAWLQSNVTIDGNGILNNADSEHIASVINGSGDLVAEPVPMQEATVTDWSDAGLVSDTEWQSPFTATSFTWDGTNIVFPFVQTDAIEVSDGITTIELRTSDRRGEIKLTTAETDFLPADWVTNYSSAEYLESQESIGQPVTILNSLVTEETGSVISLYYTDFGHPVIVIMDIYVNVNGVSIITEIAASPEDIAEVYTTFWDSVQSNGDFYPLTWPIEEIESLSIG